MGGRCWYMRQRCLENRVHRTMRVSYCCSWRRPRRAPGYQALRHLPALVVCGGDEHVQAVGGLLLQGGGQLGEVGTQLRAGAGGLLQAVGGGGTACGARWRPSAVQPGCGPRPGVGA
jgi:hypothetical protein